MCNKTTPCYECPDDVQSSCLDGSGDVMTDHQATEENRPVPVVWVGT